MTDALFSQRYFRPLEQKTLTVEIPEAARRKLWSWLIANNASVGVQRDPNDRWISNSSILEETEPELMTEHGWERIPGAPLGSDHPYAGLRHLVLHGDASCVFDAMELVSRRMENDLREAFRRKANQIFELHSCPWRISDGEFFKLDSDFVGARLASTAHDALTANRFAGAADEYAKARQYLGAGGIREAIYYAGHSFESVMKVLTGAEHANADRLLKELLRKAYFDDLPENARVGFIDQVLKALPFMRNKLGGHGQGAAVVNIPQSYGDLAVQLAAAFHNFLIAKYLERAPPPPAPDPPSSLPKAAAASWDDDIPF
ncbi:MAG: AbiJ-NTD4 domain-containing protein [Acetobacteraceae bacterium]